MGESTSYEIKDYYEKSKPVDWQKTAVEKIMTILKSGQEGDILVFIKSGADANKMKQYLEPMIRGIGSLENPFMAVLESATSKDEQRFAIEEFNYKNHPDADPARPYTRKIVFATNVAESSLTVKGAVFVIDCGLALEDLYDPLRNSRALLEKFISQSAVKQRRGRVGRTRPGVCYHLYSEKELEKFSKFPIPSIQKSDLTMDILDIMKIDYIKNFGDVKNLLNEMMNPPDKKFVDSALLNLYSMEAIASQKNSAMLTDLGRAISSFSGVPIQLARSIIASYYYHCKYDVVPIVVIIGLLQGRIENLYLDYKPKRKLSENEYKRESAVYKKNQHRFDSKYGDFLTVHNIYTEFRKFMKLPLEGGALGNNNNGNIAGNIAGNMEVLTRKTKNDAKYWCIENGIRPNIFVNMKDEKRWDKVGNESRKIDRSLMDIVQPAHLREKKFNDYKNDGGNLNKKEIKAEIKTGNAIDRIDANDFVEEDADADDVGKGGYLQFAGYNKRSYEMNFFPNSKMFNSKEDNILMSFAHGLYTNIAKNVNKLTYRACYPIEKSLCHPDNKSTVSMKIKPAFLFYTLPLLLSKILKIKNSLRFFCLGFSEIKHESKNH
jgi:HrpA-like RNA helicase